MTELNKHRANAEGYADGEEKPKTEVDEVGTQFVSDSCRHWVHVTPGPGLLDGGSLNVPCNVVVLDVAGTIDGETADGDTISGLPLAGGIVHKVSLIKITAIHTAAQVYAGWIRKPPP